jgi:osmotically-inducible protein OsmY
MKTDTQLRYDVEQELQWDVSVDAKAVGDAVDDGIVTLTGEVKSYADKWNAERATERVAGVRGVANELTIHTVGEHNDTDIAKAAANTIEWNAYLPNDDVMVKVEKGWVTLSGVVSHDYQRQAAQHSVRFMRGVKGVTDLIMITSPLDAKDLKKDIEDSFGRHAAIDAQHVKVTAHDGDVTLSGKVRSWAERRDAERTVWLGRGVNSVANHITVDSVV